jgi:hypothetical protein
MNACKKLTDAAFSDYNKMSKVTEFRIAGSPAGDKFMKAAGTWRQLQLLQAGSLVSDTGVKSFCDAKSPVRTLLLENCKVTDKGVSYLSSLPELHALSLSGDNVTDACIPTLIKLKRLEGLALQNTKITPEGYAKLKAAFPAARIRY